MRCTSDGRRRLDVQQLKFGMRITLPFGPQCGLRIKWAPCYADQILGSSLNLIIELRL